MSTLGKMTRRGFLLGSVALAGGVAFGYWKYKQPYGNPLENGLKDGDAALTPYVLINEDGISIIAPRAEMGQGIHTSLAALVAEELDVSVDAVNVIHGPAAKAYFNAAMFEEVAMGLDMKPVDPTDYGESAEQARAFMHVPAKFLGMQVTGGSSSVPDAYDKMRQAGAAARITLIKAAAMETGQPESSLKTDKGAVVLKDGTRLDYVALAARAATIEPPANPTVKDKSNWTILGKTTPRVDMVGKATGTAEFGIDVRLDGMLRATIKRNPKLGGKMNGYDASAAQDMPGVKKIIAFDDGVAVVADNTWNAFQAADAIDFDWADAPWQAEYGNDTFAALEKAIDEDAQDNRFRDDGDIKTGLETGTRLSAEYRAPYLAHATMEPMNATVWFHDGGVDIWAGNQHPTQVVKNAMALTGLPEERVTVHTTLMGGGFGRRFELDFVDQAIRIAMEMGETPVQLTWSREEDMTHDAYRPAALARMDASVDNGKVVAADLKLSSFAPTASQMGRYGLPVAGPDVAIVQAAWDQPYGIPNYRVTGYRAPEMVPLGFWRSVGASQNGFFHETMIDELAHAAGKDPLAFRLDLLTDDVSRKVLMRVADMAGWGRQLPENRALGVAFVLSFGVPTAEVIEVENTEDGIKIHHAWAATDVGIALDPGNIEAQIQGGLNFGLSAAIRGAITFEEGEAQENNFDSYDAIRMNEAPSIEVSILENGPKIKGIGEPGTPPAAPALGNAIFAATGQRLRVLPFNTEIDFA